MRIGSLLEAFGRRLRRNYIWILLTLYAAWLAKIWLFPGPPAGVVGLIDRSAVGPVPGNIVIGMGFLFYGGLLFLALYTLGMNKATGEVLPRFGDEVEHQAHR